MLCIITIERGHTQEIVKRREEYIQLLQQKGLPITPLVSTDTNRSVVTYNVYGVKVGMP